MFLERTSRFLFYPVLIIVTGLAFLPSPQVDLGTGWDKANHLLAFWVLLALLDNGYPLRRMWLDKLLPLLGYGLLIELIQWNIPDREFSLLDILADLLGMLFYLALRPLMQSLLQKVLDRDSG